MRTSWGTATDRGPVREVNEDALLAFPPVFLVADGMGGHDAGDLASRIAVAEFARLAGRGQADAHDVHECVDRASERIRAEFTHGRQGGTTVAGATLTTQDGEPYWLIFNVGDSRVYRYAHGRLDQVSVDHSVVQELLALGHLRPEEVESHPDRHVLTRALGTSGPTEPDYWLLPARSADRLVVCTDGLTRDLPDELLAEVVGRQQDPQACADELVEQALARGARDNVTVVVVDVELTAPTSFEDDHVTIDVRERDGGREVWHV